MMVVSVEKRSWLSGVALIAILSCAAIYVTSVVTAQAQDAVGSVAPVVAPVEPTADGVAAAPVNPIADVPSATSQMAPEAPQEAVAPPVVANQGGAVNATQAVGSYENLEEDDFKGLDQALKNISDLRTDIVKPMDVGTIVFTLWQHSLLQEAKRLLKVRPVDRGEDLSGTGIGMGGSASEGAAVPRGVRELSLSGILFKGKDNWIVWLNGKRLAPDALPKEIMDIKVTDEYVDLKWFDAYSNLIYPVRIRPHQRFNLDSRIFLPGITADAAAQMQSASQAQ